LRLTRRQIGSSIVLLPGAAGFEAADRVILNPSYVVLPAYAALHRAAPEAGWARIARDGLDLLRRARFGAWALPPDWVAKSRGAGNALSLPDRWPPRFSFDAVRVPLMLAWAGETGHPALLAAHRFWTDPRWRQPPAWVDLVSGQAAEFAASPGVRAIAAFVAARLAGGAIALPSVNQSEDYYSAALTLLVRIACQSTATPVA
jgi:endoglucanase